MMIPVPRRIFVVFAATNDSEIPGSSIGWSGAIGDGGTCGSGRMTCSPVHRLSKPACSAAFATAAAVFGNAHGPLLMLNSAIFIAPSYHEISGVPMFDVMHSSPAMGRSDLCSCQSIIRRRFELLARPLCRSRNLCTGLLQFD